MGLLVMVITAFLLYKILPHNYIRYVVCLSLISLMFIYTDSDIINDILFGLGVAGIVNLVPQIRRKDKL